MSKREQVISLLKQCLEDWPYAATRVPTIMNRIKNAVAILEKSEVPDTNAGKWISVKDRLPEEEGTYLVVHQSPIRDVTLAWFSGNENGWLAIDESFYEDEIITYYMPLPEPPKGEKNNG